MNIRPAIAVTRPGRRRGPRRRGRHGHPPETATSYAVARAAAPPTGSSRPSTTTAASRSRARWTATATGRAGAGGWSTTARSPPGARATTHAPSGSFSVERRMVNLRGTDKIVFKARNLRTGEVCRGVVRI